LQREKTTLDAALFWLLFFTHFALALYYKIGCGIDAEKTSAGLGVWDWYWQLLPADIMRHHLLQGLWYLHSQPPLYNLLCGIAFKLFQPHHLAVQQWVNVGLGSLAAAMTYAICKEIFRNRPAAFITAFFLALNPAVFLFEANPLYDFPCLFLVTLSGYCLVRYVKKQTAGALIGFCAGINSLILARSLYHIVLLVPLYFIVALVNGRREKKAVIIFLLIGMLSVAWYAKNAVMFGFFGGSSWFGLNLFDQVSYDILPQQATRARCDAIVFEDIFPKQSNYVPYGFTRTSVVPSLRNDDMHNINIVAISNVYLKNSLRLIRTFPGHYVKNMIRAYFIFCQPSTCFIDLLAWDAKIPGPVAAWEWLEGRMDFPWRSHVTNAVIFLPLSLVLVVLLLIHEKNRTKGRWREVMGNKAVLLYPVIMVSYTTVVSSMFEMGENNRFKFPVEQCIWILVLYSGFAVVRLSWNRARQIRGRGKVTPG
jgi:4-amino-4-deoxy-L-arabinose transferase-like glycosyltransferase